MSIPFQIHYVNVNVCSTFRGFLTRKPRFPSFPTVVIFGSQPTPQQKRHSFHQTDRAPQQAHVKHSAHRYFVDHRGSELRSPARVRRLRLIKATKPLVSSILRSSGDRYHLWRIVFRTCFSGTNLQPCSNSREYIEYMATNPLIFRGETCFLGWFLGESILH